MSELLGFLKAQKSSRGARMVLNTLDNKDLENGDGRGDDEKASCSYIKTINGMKVNDHETCYDTSDSGSAGLIEHNTLENESNEFLEESDCSVRDPDYEPSSSSKNGNSDQENIWLTNVILQNSILRYLRGKKEPDGEEVTQVGGRKIK
nr:unnamed protein product [Callosobruchus chinensis]